MRAKLVLADGVVVRGRAFGAAESAAGELVFNTSMVGYPEAMTDPSYCKQILMFTYPMIGNYGLPPRRRDRWGLPLGYESERCRVAGVVVQEAWSGPGHPECPLTLESWLAEQGVVGIEGVDTRALTQRLRARGTMPAKIVVEGRPEPDLFDPMKEILAREVCAEETRTYGDEGGLPVLLVDCGVKVSMIRALLERGARVTVAPYHADWASLAAGSAAVVLSNGPGDPALLDDLVGKVSALLDADKPVFGICLGNQILALAAGFETYKLPYGHRASNQPAVDVETGRCYITSQNHGYAVSADDVPEGWRVWFTNANDSTVEGVRHLERPFRGVQFHPEANPGPTDTGFLFDEFLEVARGWRS